MTVSVWLHHVTVRYVVTLVVPRDSSLIIGYANTFHDPALAFCAEGKLFAEAIEPPAQAKRALWIGGVHYALRSVKR